MTQQNLKIMNSKAYILHFPQNSGKIAEFSSFEPSVPTISFFHFCRRMRGKNDAFVRVRLTKFLAKKFVRTGSRSGAPAIYGDIEPQLQRNRTQYWKRSILPKTAKHFICVPTAKNQRLVFHFLLDTSEWFWISLEDPHRQLVTRLLGQRTWGEDQGNSRQTCSLSRCCSKASWRILLSSSKVRSWMDR